MPHVEFRCRAGFTPFLVEENDGDLTSVRHREKIWGAFVTIDDMPTRKLRESELQAGLRLLVENKELGSMAAARRAVVEELEKPGNGMSPQTFRDALAGKRYPVRENRFLEVEEAVKAAIARLPKAEPTAAQEK